MYPRVSTDLLPTPGHPWRPSDLLQASPGTPHTLQLRLPVAFLGPQDTEPSSPSPPLPRHTLQLLFQNQLLRSQRRPPSSTPASSKGPHSRSSRLWETPRQAVMSQRVGAVSALHLGASRWGRNPGQGGPEKASWTKGPHPRVT